MSPNHIPSFSDLIAPVSIEEFLSEDWTRRIRFVKGSPSKISGLRFGLSTLERLKSRRGTVIKVGFPDIQEQYQELTIQPEDATKYYQAGMTLCFGSVDEQHPPLRAFAARIKAELGYPHSVYFNSYLSPPTRGTQLHFDPQSVLTIQVEGRKLWRVAPEPCIPFPLRGTSSAPIPMLSYAERFPWTRLERPDRSTLQEILLEPGDILYLPAGTWHEPEAEADCHSLALALTFEPVSVLDLLREALDEELVADARWRRSLPLNPPASAGHGQRDLERLLDEHSDELARLLAKELPERMRALYARRTGRGAGTLVPDDEAAARQEPPAVQPDDRFELVQPTFFELRHDGAGEPFVFISCLPTHKDSLVPHDLLLDPALLAFAERLVEGQPFEARSARSWTAHGAEPWSWDAVRTTLQHLIAAGYVRPAAA